ncbi:MAG: leucine-rich repeat domain-containing protein [Candidatus Aminicenantes bacterium]|nr:leucine-rich repeat domain-containing protein [Candidatus Aminicenantes bacterium]
MADIEIIKEMEKILKVLLLPLKSGDISRSGKLGYSLDEMGAVTGLNLYSLAIKPVLKYVDRLRRATRLNLWGCKLEQGDIGFLRGRCDLTYLNLGANPGIKDFSFLRELKGLTSVNLSFNNLTDVSFLRELKGLTSVYLWDNNLTDVSFLRELKGLTSLGLRNNQLKDISFVADLDHLTDLYIIDNPVENPPPEIVDQGLAAIRDYFRSLKEKELCRLNEVKILLVGSGGAGKTSLLKRLGNLDFDLNEDKTHGIGIHTIDMEINNPAGAGSQSTLIHAHFWDFGGQEIMHASHQFFLSKRSLYILVVDSREEQTAEYWLKHIETFGGGSPVLVVINKIDQNPHFDLDRNILRRKYPNILDFYRISCQTRAGLPQLRDAIKSAIPQTELIKTPVAASWMKVKSTLENVTRDKCYISHNEFHDICGSAAIPTDTTRETLVQFLNELGIVLHFKDFELQEYHVLNPRWVTEGVYRIINSPSLAAQHGLLKKNELSHIINEEKTKTCVYMQELENRPYTPGEQNYIVKLMQKFELCYVLDEEIILVPALLDTKEPPLPMPEEPGHSLDFILTYDFLPKSVISRLLVKLHKDLAPGQSWRTGMVLESDLFHTRALIRADEVEKTIGIHIRGGQKREHLSVVRSALREINKSFQQMKIEELIPLPLPLPAALPDDTREKHKGAGKYARTVSYSFLLGYEREGIGEYFDGETGQRYRVAQLLDSVALPEERKREGFDIDGPKGRFHRSMDDFDRPGTGAPIMKPAPVPRERQEEDAGRYRRLKELVPRIAALEKQTAEARKIKDNLDARARKRVRLRYAILLGIDILLIAVLCILLFNKELTWGDIEPYTYIAGLLLFACNLGYLMIKGNSFSLTSIYNRNLEMTRENSYREYNFDAAKFDDLENELRQAKEEQARLL